MMIPAEEPIFLPCGRFRGGNLRSQLQKYWVLRANCEQAVPVHPFAADNSLRTKIMPDSLLPLERLMETLRERAETRPSGSYTTRLMDGGPAKIGDKILEEARELIEAAAEPDSAEPDSAGREHFVYEAGDLIYHTLVMLAYRGVDLSEVAAELARREGTSGLVEKASRENKES